MSSPSSESEKLQTSFKASVVTKLLESDLTDFARTDVVLEMTLLTLPVIFGCITAIQGYRRWNKRQMYGIINMSLNVFEKGVGGKNDVFYHRVLGELELSKLVPREGQRRLRTAIRNATDEQPILSLDKTTQIVVLNGVANQVSSMCASAFIARDLGSLNVLSDYYFIVLTAEPTRVARMKKIRAMLVKESSLREIAEMRKPPAFSDSRLRHRWKLMRHVANELSECNFKPNARFHRIEIASMA